MTIAPMPRAIRDDTRLLAAAEKGNVVLAEVLEKDPFGVKASWSVGDEVGAPANLVLTLEEKKAGALSQAIALKDFDNADRLWSRVSKSWQNLLSLRSDRTMRNLELLIGSEDGS